MFYTTAKWIVIVTSALWLVFNAFQLFRIRTRQGKMARRDPVWQIILNVLVPALVLISLLAPHS